MRAPGLLRVCSPCIPRLRPAVRLRPSTRQMLSTFKCELCGTQYKKADEYEEHLSSYNHHHLKRFMEVTCGRSAASALGNSSSFAPQPLAGRYR